MTFFYGHASVGRLARIYLHQLCVDIGYSLENLPEAIDDRDKWRESGRESGKSVLVVRLDDDDDEFAVLNVLNNMQKVNYCLNTDSFLALREIIYQKS